MNHEQFNIVSCWQNFIIRWYVQFMKMLSPENLILVHLQTDNEFASVGRKFKRWGDYMWGNKVQFSRFVFHSYILSLYSIIIISFIEEKY